MDKFAEKLSELNYEFFGVLVPGAFLLGGIVLTCWLSNCQLGPFQEPYEALSKRSYYVSLAVFIPIIYLGGQVANRFGRFGIKMLMPGWDTLRTKWKANVQLNGKAARVDAFLRERPWLKFMLLLGGRAQDNCSGEARLVFNEIKDQLAAVELFQNSGALHKSLDLWYNFYGIASRLELSGLKTSLVSTYRNKYTLHRSLAGVSGFLFWLFLGAYALERDLNLLMLAGGAFVAIRLFAYSYEYYWTLLGDTVIYELGGSLLTNKLGLKS